MKLAVVLIRGKINMTQQQKDTLKMLNLEKKNHVVVLEDTPVVKGMLKKVESHITWGPVDEATEKELSKKGKIAKLGPPKKGYGRKGIKMPFKLGGAYGNREEKINDLITRMI
jgi:large subunit ribosomal protein L30